MFHNVVVRNFGDGKEKEESTFSPLPAPLPLFVFNRIHKEEGKLRKRKMPTLSKLCLTLTMLSTVSTANLISKLFVTNSGFFVKLFSFDAACTTVDEFMISYDEKKYTVVHR